VFLYYKLTNFYQNHRRYVKAMIPVNFVETTNQRAHSIKVIASH